MYLSLAKRKNMEKAEEERVSQLAAALVPAGRQLLPDCRGGRMHNWLPLKRVTHTQEFARFWF